MQSTLMRSLRETIHRAISRKKLITLFVVFKILATHTYINYHWTICEQNKSQVWPWLLVGIPTFEIRAWTWLLSQPNINRVMVSASWGITARYPGYLYMCSTDCWNKFLNFWFFLKICPKFGQNDQNVQNFGHNQKLKNLFQQFVEVILEVSLGQISAF